VKWTKLFVSQSLFSQLLRHKTPRKYRLGLTKSTTHFRLKVFMNFSRQCLRVSCRKHWPNKLWLTKSLVHFLVLYIQYKTWTDREDESTLTSCIPTILAFYTKAEKNKKITLSCVSGFSISCIHVLYWTIESIWAVIHPFTLLQTCVHRYDRTKKKHFRSSCPQPEDSDIQEVNNDVE